MENAYERTSYIQPSESRYPIWQVSCTCVMKLPVFLGCCQRVYFKFIIIILILNNQAVATYKQRINIT